MNKMHVYVISVQSGRVAFISWLFGVFTRIDIRDKTLLKI